MKVITLLSLPVFGVMIYETWHPCYSDDTQPPGLSCRIFGAYLPFSINRINLHILSAQRCALFSSPKSPYSGVLLDMLSGIRKVRPRKTGISNPLSTNRLEHFLRRIANPPKRLINFQIDEWLKSEKRTDRPRGRLDEVAAVETDRPWSLFVVDARIDAHGAHERRLRRGPCTSISSLKKFGILVWPNFA